MTTRQELFPRLARQLGGKVGTVTGGSATHAILGGLVAVSVDPEAHKGWLLVFPNAAADQERVVENWIPAQGRAEWTSPRADTDPTNEPYLLIPEGLYTLAEMREAINETLRRTVRTVTYALPTIADETTYSLRRLSWLEHANQVQAVHLRRSPSLIHNERFELWPDGPAAAPDGWTFSGTGATLSRVTGSYGGYALRVQTGAGGGTLIQSVGLLNRQLAGQVVTAYLAAITSSAGLTVGIDDGVGVSTSAAHAAAGWGSVQVSRTIDAAATKLDIRVAITGAGDHQLELVVAVEDSAVPDLLIEHGSTGYDSFSVADRLPNIGGPTPIVVLDNPEPRKRQLVVYARRPYPELTTDTAASDCPPAVLEHGALYHLVAKHKRGQDRTQLDRLMRLHGSTWAELAQGLIDNPPAEPDEPVIIRGA